MALRPHAKAHKSPEIALLQIEKYGAVGVCCQKLCELEAMVDAGVSDVLLSNEVVQQSKLERLVHIAAENPNVEIAVCVDNADVVRSLSDLCSARSISLDVVLEVNVGQNRCGVKPEDALPLAKLIVQECQPHLRFKGIQCYHGGLQHERQWEDRQEKCKRVSDLARRVQQDLRAAGIPCDYVTGAGTGTYTFELTSGVYTEIQPGSYIFMDADYARNMLELDQPLVSRYKQSLHVLSTVMSSSVDNKRYVVDAGLKASSLDSGVPLVAGMEAQLDFFNGGDEHGVLIPRTNVATSSPLLRVGDKVKLVIGHCDPTVNLYDFLVGYRNDKVEKIIHIAARGPGV